MPKFPNKSAFTILFFLFFSVFCLNSFATSPEDFVGPSDSNAKKSSKEKNSKPVNSAVPTNSAKSSSTPVAAKSSTLEGVTAAGRLDTAQIHLIYLDGDFDKSISLIENFLNSKKYMSDGDSVFAFKHLGVMYAANTATREKGRGYMYQLINIEPTAKLMDMYACDMIYLIFHNVEEDYAVKREKAVKALTKRNEEVPVQGSNEGLNTNASSAQITGSKKTNSKRNFYITGGVVAAVGVGALLYILLDSPKTSSTNIVHVTN